MTIDEATEHMHGNAAWVTDEMIIAQQGSKVWETDKEENARFKASEGTGKNPHVTVPRKVWAYCVMLAWRSGELTPPAKRLVAEHICITMGE